MSAAVDFPIFIEKNLTKIKSKETKDSNGRKKQNVTCLSWLNSLPPLSEIKNSLGGSDYVEFQFSVN